MSLDPTDAPRITAAQLAAGHDGLAEVAIDVTYPNGATRSMSLPYEAVADALDAAAIASLDDLVGRPWSVLVPPPPNTPPNIPLEPALHPPLEGAP